MNRAHLAITALLCLAPLPAGSARAGPPAPQDPVTLECEYGIQLALAGARARAESVFVSVLSHAPGDARALNNLGNMQLLEGDPEAALAFYDRAALRDSMDGGVRLNRAVAWLVLGDDARAAEEAAAGRTLAGGAQRAEALLGLRPASLSRGSEMSARLFVPAGSKRAVRRPTVSQEELSTLITGSRAAPRQGATAAPKPAQKASEAGGGVALLYWKF